MKTLEGIAAVSQELKLRCQVGAGPPCGERLGLGPFTEGPLGFSRRIYPGRRRERSLQEACLSFTGSASPTSGQGEPPAHGLTWVGGVTRRRGLFCLLPNLGRCAGGSAPSLGD